MSIEHVVNLFRARQPACGSCQVLAIDGPSGAGKTDLATTLSNRLNAPVLHLDALHAGWRGLEAAPPMVEKLFAAHALDDPSEITVWDWEHDAPGESVSIPPTPLLIVEGVGAGAQSLRPFESLLVWVEAPADVRRTRAMARDGATYEPWWDVWAAQEATHFRREGTRDAADLVISTV